LPQFQPIGVQLQFVRSIAHVMLTVGQADISAGTVIGQSAGDQHAHVLES
jgi:hypothetical protein